MPCVTQGTCLARSLARVCLRGVACATLRGLARVRWRGCHHITIAMFSTFVLICIVYYSYYYDPVSCLPSLVSCLLSLVSCLLSPVSCLPSPVSCLLFPVSCLLSPVSCLSASRQSEVLRTSCACLAQALRGIDVSSPSWMDGG